MDTKTIIIIIIALILIGAIGYGLYVWLRQSIYTREKFAFTGLTAVSALAILVITHIAAKESPFSTVIGLIRQFSNLPYEAPQPLTIEQNILLIITFFGFSWFITNLHRNWHGAQSINHHNQQQKQEKPSLINDAYLFSTRSKHQDKLAIYNPANIKHISALEGAEDNAIWSEQARELLLLSNNNYDFPKEQWHDEQHCWFGLHKATKDTIILACYENIVNDNELNKLITYAQRCINNASLKFIVALKDGDIDKKIKIDNYSIHIISESKLLDNLVNFDNYFYELCKRVEQDNLIGSELTLNKVYTASRYSLNELKNAEQDNLEVFFNTWLAESSQRQLALLGEYGQGKSTASLMLSYHLIQQVKQNKRSARIPILLELRGKSPRTLREDELLSTWAGRYGIDTRALVKLLIAGRLLLIFEGFDEVDLAGDAEMRVANFRNMWRLCYPKAKIIITGRPNFFLDDNELKSALGIKEASLQNPYCQAVNLMPFNFKEIENSLRHVSNNTRAGILELAKKNERFYDIIARPSMLHVVSILWEQEDLAQYGEKVNSALIMDLFIRHSLERQSNKAQRYEFASPIKSKAKPDFMALNSHERAYFMSGIAVYMLVKQLPNQLSITQLEEVVRLLIDSIPEAVSLQADAQSDEPYKPLRERYDLKNKPENVQTLLSDVRACGLLVPDLSRSGCFKFGHKSFMEFLAGKVFAQFMLRKELSSVEEQSVSALTNKLGLKMNDVVEQLEPMAFAVEWIAEKAKNQEEAANIIFDLLFRQYNYFMKSVGSIIKIATWFLVYTKNSFIFFKFAVLHEKIMTTTNSLSLTKSMIVFLTVLTGVSEILKISTGTSYFIKILIDINAFILISIPILITLFIIIFDIYSDLMIGYKKQESYSFFVKLRIWQAICTAAHLERSAMVNVIGEKSLQLLEEVANNEPKAWTIAESLEKLKAFKMIDE
ncbi:MAG: hypothetical protein WAX77_12155 [Methylococcaceae bacterium]